MKKILLIIGIVVVGAVLFKVITKLIFFFAAIFVLAAVGLFIYKKLK